MIRFRMLGAGSLAVALLTHSPLLAVTKPKSDASPGSARAVSAPPALEPAAFMAEIEELIRRRVEGLLRSPVRPPGSGILTSG